MSIEFFKERKIFHLQNEEISYAIKILKNGQLGHLYWGKKIKNAERLNRYPITQHRPYEAYAVKDDTGFILENIAREYPSFGQSDFREPAYQIKAEDGSIISDLKYRDHQIYRGKKDLKGLPATYVEKDSEADSLEITLYDEVLDLEVTLIYTIFRDYPVITRSANFNNNGKQNINLKRALSMSVDFENRDFELLQLSGAWGRERDILRRSLDQGITKIDSKRGGSSHQQNPFAALVEPDTDEYSGEAYGFSLIYSANFIAQAEKNHYGKTRMIMGINPFNFSWLLESAQSFQTPEVVMNYSDQGLNKMSQNFHQLYRSRLVQGRHRDQERPVLINNWEGTYFDFNTDKILEMAEAASKVDIELFVLDDGWFGKRNDDTSSLGDWYVNEDKLPGGLEYLAQEINKLGMDFGLWFEPEMISPDSDLYREHPEWSIQLENRESSLSRQQLILDLSRRDVQDYIIERVSAILNKANISYVKWDMNRPMTEYGSLKLKAKRQRELNHRYILGLYRVLEEITSRFPDILFESCAGGGGRFDPGMLYYMPQTWTSDDTDAVERLKIQYGTSMVYPASSMGAHVSAVPNHQVERSTSLKMRYDVASFGNLGYELDITELNPDQIKAVKNQVKNYKEIRRLVQFGDFYRLQSPFESNFTAWSFVAEAKEEVLVGFYQILASPNPREQRIKLKGLDADSDYKELNSANIYGGDELMNYGIKIPYLKGDFSSKVWRFQMI
ncbi:alpha-galactosidase [Halanaerobium saccharolyticum]|uniref:Alpha-galactosidase n=1 Tax=Halanaerobium saccharolyticum TaxID=43595 RepID=A0A4R7YUN6_9FIRM|nr:alpha-galactosidase [Halanaerobium saccharolyticum]RAK05249.1 alpha-galactosidase [Halanaerobium saccharolyticum]TDV99614.1 alpha-galactosidase [Halanaerobium saccharolyticum]TDX51730.1 alpha-galactosidase [Halanaerobium saccharolyticum]